MRIMNYLVDIKIILRKHFPLMIGVFLFAYFFYHAATGDRSFVRMAELETIVASKEMLLAALENEHQTLEERVSMMRPSTLSADMAEEQIRYVLGYHLQHEIVVISD